MRVCAYVRSFDAVWWWWWKTCSCPCFETFFLRSHHSLLACFFFTSFVILIFLFGATGEKSSWEVWEVLIQSRDRVGGRRFPCQRFLDWMKWVAGPYLCQGGGWWRVGGCLGSGRCRLTRPWRPRRPRRGRQGCRSDLDISRWCLWDYTGIILRLEVTFTELFVHPYVYIYIYVWQLAFWAPIPPRNKYYR